MRLRDLREDHDLKQSDIASYLNIRHNTYSQYENGVRQIPNELLISKMDGKEGVILHFASCK